MSRMMKLRIALGNAILPNVPQARDFLIFRCFADCVGVPCDVTCGLECVGYPDKVTRGAV